MRCSGGACTTTGAELTKATIAMTPLTTPVIAEESGRELLRRLLRLFRIKSQRLELPAPFGWWIAKPLDTDAPRQKTLLRLL